MAKTSVRKRTRGESLLELPEEEEARMRLDQLSLDDIFTTGLSHGEVDRYFPSSRKFSKIGKLSRGVFLLQKLSLNHVSLVANASFSTKSGNSL